MSDLKHIQLALTCKEFFVWNRDVWSAHFITTRLTTYQIHNSLLLIEEGLPMI